MSLKPLIICILGFTALSSYGQHGGVIIKRTLDLMFRGTTAYTTLLSLDFNSFNDYVLRPEVGVRLIMEDYSCTWEDAYTTWIESGTYGDIQFPYQDDDPTVGLLHKALR